MNWDDVDQEHSLVNVVWERQAEKAAQLVLLDIGVEGEGKIVGSREGRRPKLVVGEEKLVVGKTQELS